MNKAYFDELQRHVDETSEELRRTFSGQFAEGFNFIAGVNVIVNIIFYVIVYVIVNVIINVIVYVIFYVIVYVIVFQLSFSFPNLQIRFSMNVIIILSG